MLEHECPEYLGVHCCWRLQVKLRYTILQGRYRNINWLVKPGPQSIETILPRTLVFFQTLHLNGTENILRNCDKGLTLEMLIQIIELMHWRKPHNFFCLLFTMHGKHRFFDNWDDPGKKIVIWIFNYKNYWINCQTYLFVLKF